MTNTTLRITKETRELLGSMKRIIDYHLKEDFAFNEIVFYLLLGIKEQLNISEKKYEKQLVDFFQNAIKKFEEKDPLNFLKEEGDNTDDLYF